MASKTRATTPRRTGAKADAPPVKLSELESAVLGVFWRRGPCSAYVVQQNFRPISAGWSASPGSVYPLIQKLERLKLITGAEREARGERQIKRYVLTPAGLNALKAWIGRFPEWSGLAAADPIRTRSFFLDTLSAAERLAFIDEAEARTKTALASLRAGAETVHQQSLERLAQLGGIYSLYARLKWLRLLREEIKNLQA